MTQRQSHTERLELLKKKRLDAGLVSDRFPGVSGIVFRMTYYQSMSTPVLMVRTINFIPSDYAYFRLECMRDECTNGGFDLTQVVAGLVKDHKKSVKGKIVCNGKNDALAPGHASIAYEVSIQYDRQPK